MKDEAIYIAACVIGIVAMGSCCYSSHSSDPTKSPPAKLRRDPGAQIGGLSARLVEPLVCVPPAPIGLCA